MKYLIIDGTRIDYDYTYDIRKDISRVIVELWTLTSRSQSIVEEIIKKDKILRDVLRYKDSIRRNSRNPLEWNIQGVTK